MSEYTFKEVVEFYIKNYIRSEEGRKLIKEVLQEEDTNNLNIGKEKEKEETITLSEVREIFEGIENFEEEDIDKGMRRIRDIIIHLLKKSKESESKNKELLEKNAELERVIEKLKEEEKKLISGNEELERDLSSKKGEVIKLNGIKEKLEGDIRILNNKISEKNGDIFKLGREIEGLNEEIENKRNRIDDLENIKGEKEREIKKLLEESKIDKGEVERLQKELGKFEELRDLQRVYELYQSVPENYKDRLSNLIKGENINEFMACCYSLSTMDDLWDFLNNEVRNGDLNETTLLKNLFIYFIEQQNKKYNETTYRVLIPMVGEEFDPTKHTAINGVSSGVIEEVIFPGYGNLESKDSEDQRDEDRKFKRIRKLAMVRVR